jgi:integrase/recombinase XerD
MNAQTTLGETGLSQTISNPALLSKATERFLEHCRIGKRLSNNTLRAYKCDLFDFGIFIGAEVPVSNVNRENLRSYAKHLFDDRSLKEASVRRKVASLKVMFSWLEREESIATNPFHRIDLAIKMPHRLPRALSNQEFSALLAHCKSEKSRMGLQADHDSRLLHFIVICMLVTGVRVGEIVSIEIDDVLKDKSAMLVHGKGNRERWVYFPYGIATKALDHYLRFRGRIDGGSERVVVSREGKPVSTNWIRKQLASLAALAGIRRRITPHMLRHTAATQLVEAGVDIRFVQKLLGHASIGTTQIYTQVSDASLRQTIQKANTVERFRKA